MIIIFSQKEECSSLIWTIGMYVIIIHSAKTKKIIEYKTRVHLEKSHMDAGKRKRLTK